MSVWIDANKQMPPLDEEVVVLYKDKKNKLSHENLHYAIAHRFIWNPFHLDNGGVERWSDYTEYQGYYEVMYWARIYDMPAIKNDNGEYNYEG